MHKFLATRLILRRYAAARVMQTSITWSPAPSLNVVSAERGEQAWRVTVDSRQPTSCPGCGMQSKSRHSTYWRTLRDLSAQARRSSSTHAWGAGGVETSGVIGASSPSACLAGIVRLLGHSAGGRPSERLMRRLGMPVSDTTILRGLKEHAKPRSDS